MDTALIALHLRQPTAHTHAVVNQFLAQSVDAAAESVSGLLELRNDEDAQLCCWFALSIYETLAAPRNWSQLPPHARRAAKDRIVKLLLAAAASADAHARVSAPQLSLPLHLPPTPQPALSPSNASTIPQIPSFLAQKLNAVVARIAARMYSDSEWIVFDDLPSINNSRVRLALTERVVDEFLSISIFASIGARPMHAPQSTPNSTPSSTRAAASLAWSVPVIADCLTVLNCASHSPTSFPSVGLSPSRGDSLPHSPVHQQKDLSPATASIPRSVDMPSALSALKILALLAQRVPMSEPIYAFRDMVSSFGVYAASCDDLDVAGEALGALADVCNARKKVEARAVGEFMGGAGVGGGVVRALRRSTGMAGVGEEPRVGAHNGLGGVDEQYTSKLIHLMSSFMRNHIKRVESVPGFPLDEFLQLLFKFTFMQSSAESFIDCIRIWELFIDFLTAQQNLGISVNRYRDGLVSLSRYVVPALLYSQGSKYLDDLSFDRSDGHESEWDSFSNTCLSLIAKISDLFPADIVQQVIELFIGNEGLLLQVAGPKLDAACRDLCTIARLIGQIAHFFCNLGDFEENLKDTVRLVERILELLKAGLDGQDQGRVAKNILCCELLGSLRMYIHWMEKYFALANVKGEHAHDFSVLLNAVLDVAVTSLLSKDADIVVKSSQLLFSVAYTIRPNIVLFPAMRPLLSNAHGIARNLVLEAKQNLYKVVTLAIVVPVNATKVSEEEWNSRLSQLNEFFSTLVQPFQSLFNAEGKLVVNAQDPLVRGEVRHVLEALTAAMQAVDAEAANPKNVVYLSIKPVIVRALSLFEVYAQDSAMLLDLFNFTQALQVSLKRQSSRENGTLVVETLQLFMKMVESKGLLHLAASQQQKGAANGLDAVVASADLSQLHLLDKFLEFLTAIVQDNSKTIEALLNDIFVFCQYSFKFIAHEDSANESLKLHFFDLLFTLLTFHQRYYFGSTVSRSASQHEHEVAGMLEMIANSFSDRNMEVFRHNLAGLNSVNVKCTLYLKEFFQKHMMVPFIDLFLGILIAKGHDFMKDEIVDTLAKIMTCHTPYFRHEYVPHFMVKYCSGLHSQDQATLFNCINGIENGTNTSELISSLVVDLVYFQKG
ncbi:hypothetical protein BC830DRAFT_1113101 [Chytriomyces sp. MP71]|nr:hypothetical protein BC830DRAFT_1113101 [Chytriomyces sp. MP71]